MLLKSLYKIKVARRYIKPGRVLLDVDMPVMRGGENVVKTIQIEKFVGFESF